MGALFPFCAAIAALGVPWTPKSNLRLRIHLLGDLFGPSVNVRPALRTDFVHFLRSHTTSSQDCSNAGVKRPQSAQRWQRR